MTFHRVNLTIGTLPTLDVATIARREPMEKVGKGRYGVLLGRETADGAMPLVRSTTAYENPMIPFMAIHESIAEKVAAVIGRTCGVEPPVFNNIMEEMYTNESRCMGYHSDQSMDLADGSWIAIFSTYSCGASVPESSIRRLEIRNKETGEESFLHLGHMDVIYFNTETNAKFQHRIVLPDGADLNNGVNWMGMTFRTSKRFVKFVHDTPILHPDGEVLRLITDDVERRAFYRMRSLENQSLDFKYPEMIDYTVSKGDLINYRTHLKNDETVLSMGHTLHMCDVSEKHPEAMLIRHRFAGCVYDVSDEGLFTADDDEDDEGFYLAGDIQKILSRSKVHPNTTLLIIDELSFNLGNVQEEFKKARLVTPGEVPLNIHGIGVLYRRLFRNDSAYFDRIEKEHGFQSLTESNKAGTALRSGLYITEVMEEGDEGDDALAFRLLRCSSNFTGPTENVRPTDREILEKVNRTVRGLFNHSVNFNHVLAQIYHNNPKSGKARIKEHSDKTEDMPLHAGIAFCTFYDGKWHPNVKSNGYDMCYNGDGLSALTTLVFRLKEKNPTYQDNVSVTLYPGSVFFIPLRTNRLYTHEIRPSPLQAEHLATRMGYVVRCSKAEALHKDGQTFLKTERHGELIPLEPATPADVRHLRDLYFLENTTKERVAYGKIHFSMNNGDYMRPLI